MRSKRNYSVFMYQDEVEVNKNAKRKEVDIQFYYPTLLRRVQIKRETSMNIIRYLYSSHSPRSRERLNSLASQNFGKARMLDNTSLIRHFSVYCHSTFLFIICILNRTSSSPKYCMTRALVVDITFLYNLHLC